MENSDSQSQTHKVHHAQDFVSAVAGLASACNRSSSPENSVRLDHARRERCGFPEFIYGENKNMTQLTAIIEAMLQNEQEVFVTRLDAERGMQLAKQFPSCEYDSVARTLGAYPASLSAGHIAVVCAGSSDLPVAREALNTLRACGFQGDLTADVGVAGIERLFAAFDDRLRSADVCIVVAGMEGALPSVIGGLLKCPVIAVPTSVGYGSALNGMTALFGMLNSCASGLTVVNIDNGFGAACAASRIMRSKYLN